MEYVPGTPGRSVEVPTITFLSGVIIPENAGSAAIETIPVVLFTEITVGAGGVTGPADSSIEVKLICPIPLIDPSPFSQALAPPI